jgi:tetratricopeptide (TPR) repeat protein
VTATGFTESSLLSDLGSRTGTRLYTAPELLAGKPPTIQSDIYALGVLLYQVVVGDLHRPLAQGWESDVDNPSLRSDIAACVTGSLAFRLQSADELADRLRRLDQRERDRIRAERAVRSKAIRKRVAILSALAAPLLALVAFAYWRSQESDAGRVLAELKKAIDAGVRFTENQNWDHAESAFQNAQSLKPDHPNLWFQHARMKLLQVNHVPPAEAEPLLQQAERLCSRGLEFDPDSADGLNYHGIILKKLNRFDDAIKAYESVTRLQPDYFAAWVNLGTVHALAGHPHLAEDLLTKSTEMASQDDNPDRFAYSAQAWRNLASLQLHLNNLDAARANINEALHRNRNDWSVWAVSARVDLEAPDPASHERALDDAKHADAVSGGTEPLAKRVLARACLVNDRFQDAIDAASAAMKSDENPTLCHLIIACASARLDDSDNARSALAFAEQSWPPDVRSAGQFAVSAPKGILWYDEAKTLLNLKNDAESTLYGTSP